MLPALLEALRQHQSEVDIARPRLDPALEALQGRVRDARRAVRRGRYATEDLAAAATLGIRRRPLASIAVVGAAGALVGCLVGLALGRRSGPRTL